MNQADSLEDRPGDEKVRSVRRAVHTLKGDSAACGFRELSELAHELEDVLTPELTQQHAGLIPEVVLAAADTFHEMLAAYRNNLQPPAGGALREHIQRLLTKPAVQPRVARETFEWTNYERLVIAEALRRGDTSQRCSVPRFRIAARPRSSWFARHWKPEGCSPSPERQQTSCNPA
jgi:two-component system chemotaxis sensor kinase CheA